MSQSCLRNLFRLEYLRTVDLSENYLSERQLHYVAKSPSIRQLALVGCEVEGGNSCLDLSKMKSLEDLVLNMAFVSDEDVHSITLCTTLRALSLRGCFCLTDISYRHLKNMTNLRALDVGLCENMTKRRKLLYLEFLDTIHV